MLRRVARRLVLVAIPLLAAWTGHWLAAVLAGFAGLCLYGYSVKFLCWVPCWRCNGTGMRQHRGLLGWLFVGATGWCLRCQGGQRDLRWGTRVLGITPPSHR